ncbi:Ephrin type-B receptor 3 (Fragment) [Seminavis robusta]|uniref:guanylate cyclase n=1 Tax=Seminavis robusta TaxID=568900 RepID=A0A9N8HPZ5_9STRA
MITIRLQRLHLFLLASAVLLLIAGIAAQQEASSGCVSAMIQPYDPVRHEPHYTIGVLANRGDATALKEWNMTFGEYLTETAGRRFNPPIRFSMRPLSFGHIFEEHQQVDFIHVNPAAYSCIAAEYGAQPLVSQVSRRTAGDRTYNLDVFGGVIVALANNTGINVLEDLKDKIIATASISGLGSGQMQFRELQRAGLSYIQDPKQLVFTSNQGKIVKGLTSGQFDVGFIRTDQLERSNGDEDLETFLKRFKTINLQPPQTMENGEVFPFQTSTPLYPEWGLSARSHVDEAVSRAVQESLTALSEHALVGQALQDCIQDFGQDFCAGMPFPDEFVEDARCDTTPEIAQLSRTAMTAGKYAGWRTTLSYMDLRSMQEDTGFMRFEEKTHSYRCVRSVELYDAITCPDGYFRKTPKLVDEGCSASGLECPSDMQCVCKPCLRGYDVDVFPLLEEENDGETRMTRNTGGLVATTTTSAYQGCAKMSLCGETKQTKPLTFRAVDNLKRSDLQMDVLLHEGQESRQVPVVPTANFTYEFTLSARLVGVMTLEIFAGEEQIPESPLRILVNDRACAAEFGGEYEANSSGECVCKGNYVSMGGACVPYAVLLPAIFVPLCFLVAIVALWYVGKKQREADAIWRVDYADLKFTDTVLGQGTFGEVLLAEYRGTQVAVKHVLPPKVGSDDPRASLVGVHIPEGRVAAIEGHRESRDQYLEEDLETGSDTGSLTPLPEFAPKEPRKRSSDAFGLVSGYRVGTKSNLYLRDIRGRSCGKGSTERTSAGASRSRHSKLKRDFVQEMRLLSKLRHPCITTVMGAVMEPEPMLVLEYCEHGSLYGLLHNETVSLEGEVILPILRDLANGIRFLHTSSPAIIHGDLKSQNVLVTSGMRCKVADFGLSQKAKNAKARGTPYFMAPELLRGETPCTTESDIYSVGLVLWEVYARRDPYEGEDCHQVLTQVTDKRLNLRPPIPQGCPREVSSLMKSCWSGSPKSRPTAEALDERLKMFHVGNVQPGAMTMKNLIKKDQDKPKTISNEDFLYKCFPRHVADSLVRGEKVAPESHDCVTIFFSDIVGFTTISSTCSPLKVSDMLDRLYLALDALSEKHGLFKVETIGDAFMAVSNLLDGQSHDHVKRVAAFSLEAIEAASKISVDLDDPSKGFVEIRCGFHSGPVVSSVVGSLNPRYGLFGDSVNVASRMESSSIPGKVHCSEVSAQLLMRQAPEIVLMKRGEVDIKGKGRMQTYFVTGSNQNDSNMDFGGSSN